MAKPRTWGEALGAMANALGLDWETVAGRTGVMSAARAAELAAGAVPNNSERMAIVTAIPGMRDPSVPPPPAK